MDHDKFKPIVKSILGRYGLQGKDIPEADDSKRPDIEVNGENDRYLIELKIKGDDPAEISSREEKLSKGELATVEKLVRPKSNLFGIIEDGVKQMKEFDTENQYFKVLWLHSTGPNSPLHFENLFSTLFGEATLVSLGKSHTLKCYYFHESAFFTWRKSLDGAILSYALNNKLSIQLCINTLSPRVQRFRESELIKVFADGTCDPDKLAESVEGIMIADCDIDRKKTEEVLNYLQDKYHLDHLQFMQMVYTSATAAIPKNDEQR